MRYRGCAPRRKPRGTCTAPKSSRSSLSRRQRRRPRRRQRLSRSSPPIRKSSTCRYTTLGSCTGPGLTPPIRPITGTRRDTWPVQDCSRSRRALSLGPRSGATATGGGDVNINIDRYSQFTKIDRTNIRNTWQHNAEHRRGTPYRDRGSQQRFGQRDLAGAQTREAFRGRAEQGRERPGERGGDLGERGGQGQRFEGRHGQGLGQTREAGGPFPAWGMVPKHGPTAIAAMQAAAVGVDFPVTVGVLGAVGVDFPGVAGLFTRRRGGRGRR